MIYVAAFFGLYMMIGICIFAIITLPSLGPTNPKEDTIKLLFMATFLWLPAFLAFHFDYKNRRK